MLTQKLKANIFCSHFVWSPENQNIHTIWCLNLDNVKRQGKKNKHYVCIPASIRTESNGVCELSRAAVTSLEKLDLSLEKGYTNLGINTFFVCVLVNLWSH